MISSLVNLDHSIFYFFYNPSGRFAWLDFLIVFCGEYLIYLVVLFVFWHAYRLWRKHGGKAFIPYLEALVSVAIGNAVLVPVVRIFYERVRPYVAFHLTHNLLIDPAFSFPSGHTIFMFALATSIFFYDKKFGTFLYVCGILIGVARIAAGVHYPSDIFGGAVFGIAIGILVYKIIGKAFSGKYRNIFR